MSAEGADSDDCFVDELTQRQILASLKQPLLIQSPLQAVLEHLLQVSTTQAGIITSLRQQVGMSYHIATHHSYTPAYPGAAIASMNTCRWQSLSTTMCLQQSYWSGCSCWRPGLGALP